MKIQKYSKGKQLEEMSVLDAQIAEASKNASAEAKQAAQNLVASTQNYLNSDPLHNGQERRLQIEMKRKILSILTSGEDLEKRLQGNPVYDPYRMGTADKNSFGFYTRGELDNIANEIARQTFTAPKEQTVTTGTPASSIIPSWDFKKFLQDANYDDQNVLGEHTDNLSRANHYKRILQDIINNNVYNNGSISGVKNGVTYQQLENAIKNDFGENEAKASSYIDQLNKLAPGLFKKFSSTVESTPATPSNESEAQQIDRQATELINKSEFNAFINKFGRNDLTNPQKLAIAKQLIEKGYSIKNDGSITDSEGQTVPSFAWYANYGDNYGFGFEFDTTNPGNPLYYAGNYEGYDHHISSAINLANEYKNGRATLTGTTETPWNGNYYVGDPSDEEYSYKLVQLMTRLHTQQGLKIDISPFFKTRANEPVVAFDPNGKIDSFGKPLFSDKVQYYVYDSQNNKAVPITSEQVAEKITSKITSDYLLGNGARDQATNKRRNLSELAKNVKDTITSLVREHQEIIPSNWKYNQTYDAEYAIKDLHNTFMNEFQCSVESLNEYLRNKLLITADDKRKKFIRLFIQYEKARIRQSIQTANSTADLTLLKKLQTEAKKIDGLPSLQQGGFVDLSNEWTDEKLRQAYSHKALKKKTDDQFAFEAGWSKADKARMAGIGLDIVSMLAAIAGDGGATVAGWGVSAGAGVGSTIANTYADFTDKSMTTGQAIGNIFLNLGIDAASTFLPHVASIKLLKSSKPLLRKIGRNAHWARLAVPVTFGGITIKTQYENIGEAVDHLFNLKSKDFTVQDAALLGAVINAVTGTTIGTRRNIRISQMQKHGSAYKGKAGETEFKISEKTKDQIDAVVAKGQKNNTDHAQTRQQVIDTLRKDRYHENTSEADLNNIADSILKTREQTEKSGLPWHRTERQHTVSEINDDALKFDFDIDNVAKNAYLGLLGFRRTQKGPNGRSRTDAGTAKAKEYLTTLTSYDNGLDYVPFLRRNRASRRTTGMDATIQPGQTTPQAAFYRSSRKNTFSSADGQHRIETTNDGIVYTNPDGHKTYYNEATVVKNNEATVIKQDGAPTITITPGEKTIHINTGGENVELNFGGSKPKKQKTASTNNPESVATESQAIVNQTSETKPKNNKKVSEAVTKFLHNLSERKKKAQQAWRDYRNFTWGAVETNKRHVTGSNRRAVASSDGGFTNNPADRPVTPPETSRFSPDGNATTFDVSRRRTTNPKEGNDMSDAAIREFLNKNNLNDQFGQKKNGHWYAKGANKEKIGKRGNSSQVQFKQTPSGHVYIVKNGSKLNRLQTYLNSK